MDKKRLEGRQVAGFSVAYKINPDEFPELRETGIRLEKAAYGAELALQKEYRGQGTGSALLRQRIERFKGFGYLYMVGRTAIGSEMEPLYRKFEYECLGILNQSYPARNYWVSKLATDEVIRDYIDSKTNSGRYYDNRCG
ncbi:MAG: GNAT family N-acetyltransferase [Candidatus Micrarchaeales archaeon]